MSRPAKLIAFAGSTREASWNKKLVKIAAEGAREAGAEVTLIDLGDYPMPVYDQGLEEKEGVHENAMKLQTLFKEHDGFIISSPEHNSSYPALIKNVIDWASRKSDAADSLEAFRGKTAVIMGASPGGLGGLRALVPLRMLLGNIGITVIPEQRAVGKTYEVFDDAGQIKDPDTEAAVKGLGAKLAEVTAKLV